MKLKTLAIAAFIVNFYVAVPGSAQAQLYNGASDAGSAATPVFIPKAGPEPTGGVYNNTSNTPQPVQSKTKPMTDSEYAKMVAQNQQKREAQQAESAIQYNARAAAANAETRKQLDDQAKARMAAAAQAGGAQPAAAGPSEVFDPYAGQQVIFSGKKKTDDGPVRLFNVQ